MTEVAANRSLPERREPHTAAASAYVTGDRLCIGCGYNLLGQSIVREPHYDLLIVRCPECGSVTAVQEYPLLGRWAHRWGMVLAALWMLLIIVGWTGSGGLIMGLGMAAVDQAAEPYSDFIQKVFSQVELQAKAQAASGSAPSTPNLPPGTIIIQRSGGSQQITTIGGPSSGTNFVSWWLAQDHQALLDQVGGWRSGLIPEVIAIWIFCALLVVVLGWLWSIILIQLKRRGLLIWTGSVLAAAAAFSMIPLAEAIFTEPSWVWNAGWYQLAPLYQAFSIVIYAAALVIGVMTGRPLARQLIRMFLPPRMRYALAALWTCDGRALPTVE